MQRAAIDVEALWNRPPGLLWLEQSGHRVLGCQSAEPDYTMLVGCTHDGKKYDPPDGVKSKSRAERHKSKQHREAYVPSQIKINLPFQIGHLEERGLSQGDLATLAKMAQPRISEIENPGARRLNLETLQRVASGLDVGFQARFVSLGELVDWSEGFDPNHFHIPSFAEKMRPRSRPVPR